MTMSEHPYVIRWRNSQLHCYRCSRTWDADDDEPPCIAEGDAKGDTTPSAEEKAARADAIVAAAGLVRKPE